MRESADSFIGLLRATAAGRCAQGYLDDQEFNADRWFASDVCACKRGSAVARAGRFSRNKLGSIRLRNEASNPTASQTTHLTWGARVKGFMVNDQYIGKIKTTLILGFLDDKFSHVHIMFESKDYSVLRDAFKERYGPPLTKNQSQLKTALGAEYTNEILTWKGPTLQIQIQRYAGSIRDARAHLTTHEYNEEMNKQLKQRGKSTAKDL